MPATDYTHSPTPEDIMAYLDGEGDPASRAAIEGHLAGCEACVAVASEHRRLSDRVGHWRVQAAPASLRVPAMVTSQAPRRGIFQWRWGTLAAVAASGVVLLLAATLTDRRGIRTLGQMASETPYERPQPNAVRRLSEAIRVGGAPRRPTEVTAAPMAPAPATDPVPEPTSMMESVSLQTQGPIRQPSVIRTMTLRLVVRQFDGIRQAVESIVTGANGFFDQLTVTGDAGAARSLGGTLRVPADSLAAVAERLRQLGQVVEDTQGSEDVTDQVIDLDARLASARATERRMTELLRTRTGKLSDVLEVERELTRVRLDIERLDGERTGVGRRVSYATITLIVDEERKARLDPGPLSFASQVRVAAANGIESVLLAMISILLFLLSDGPVLVLWAIVLGGAWLVGRRALRFWARRRGVAGQPAA